MQSPDKHYKIFTKINPFERNCKSFFSSGFWICIRLFWSDPDLGVNKTQILKFLAKFIAFFSIKLFIYILYVHKNRTRVKTRLVVYMRLWLIFAPVDYEICIQLIYKYYTECIGKIRQNRYSLRIKKDVIVLLNGTIFRLIKNMHKLSLKQRQKDKSTKIHRDK